MEPSSKFICSSLSRSRSSCCCIRCSTCLCIDVKSAAVTAWLDSFDENDEDGKDDGADDEDDDDDDDDDDDESDDDNDDNDDEFEDDEQADTAGAGLILLCLLARRCVVAVAMTTGAHLHCADPPPSRKTSLRLIQHGA